MPSPFQFGASQGARVKPLQSGMVSPDLHKPMPPAVSPRANTTPPTAADFFSPTPAPSPAPAQPQTPMSFGQQVGNAISGVANKAIQSPLGQTALGGVSHAYNNYMPQAGKKFVERQLPLYVEPDSMQHFSQYKNVTQTPFKPMGFEHGVHIDSQDTLTNMNGRRTLDSRIDSNTPARITGSPLQQIGFGLSHGQMPGQTFQPGTMANIHRQVRNDELTKNELTAPHPEFAHLK